MTRGDYNRNLAKKKKQKPMQIVEARNTFTQLYGRRINHLDQVLLLSPAGHLSPSRIPSSIGADSCIRILPFYRGLRVLVV